MRLLLVEDQTRLSSLLKRSLVEDGYVVDVADTAEAADTLYEVNDYNLVILDVMLPDESGLELCRMIRAKNLDVPIIMLTALDGVDERVAGLDSGADDYLVKPFSMDELSARIRALLRRRANGRPTLITVGNLTLDPATKAITYHGEELTLTAKEFVLLSYFMYHPGVLISKTELLEHAWDMNYDGLSNVVETYVRYVRAKLHAVRPTESVIRTVRTMGYMLES